MIDLESLFAIMQQRFNPQAAQSINAVFQYNLSDQQSFSCEIKDAACILSPGKHSAADIELSLDSSLFLQIISGQADALQAFMQGSILAKGDVSLAPALGSLFAEQPSPILVESSEQ